MTSPSAPRGRAAALRVLSIALAATAALTCESATSSPPAGDRIAAGTWGDSGVGVVVSDTGTHVHIACTFGDVAGIIALDVAGNFDVEGSYVLRAYPVVLGPSLPARFTGRVRGATLTLTVTITDTVENQTVVRGPVTARYGRTPQLGPCPICQFPPWARSPALAPRSVR